MAKINIKESMKKVVTGVLLLDGEEILIEVDDYDEPFNLKEMYSAFHGRKVTMSVDLKIDHSPLD